MKLLQFLHDARLNSGEAPELSEDFSGTDWSKIMKSGEKLNKLIKCIFNLELAKKDPDALKALLWNKSPNYFDSSSWATTLNSLTTADFRKYAENLVELTSIKGIFTFKYLNYRRRYAKSGYIHFFVLNFLAYGFC